MSEARLMFGNRQASGDSALAGAPALAINVLVDGKGAVRRRPGISAWDGFPATIADASEIQGITTFEDEVYYVNAGRRVRRVNGSGDTQLSTSDPVTLLAGTSRPVFASTPYRLVIAGGGVPLKVESGASVTAVLGGSPPSSTSVLAQSERLFSNDLTSAATSGKIRFSAPGTTGEEEWDALDFATAAADPDPLTAIHGSSNEMFAFGERSLQIFNPDPVGVITPGRALRIGVTAGYSPIQVDESFGVLDIQRRFLLTDGRAYEDISGEIAATIDNITTVSDCWGFRYNADQFDCLVWVMPSDGRSFAWQRGSGWGQWHGWNAGHSLLPVRSHHYWQEENVHLVGLATGQIAQLDSTANTDLGATIKAEVTTGFQNHDTDGWKHCQALHLVFQRGQSATAGTVLLSWRDSLGEYGNPVRVSLGVTGDYVQTVTLRSLGMYRQRDWKLEMSDAVDLVLARAVEVYTTEGSN